MVEIVLGVAVFALTVAVVGLFAMMGELASRVPDPVAEEIDPDAPPRPLAEVRLGAEAERWPAELADVPEQPLAHVLVFGASCGTCRRILSGGTGPLDVLDPRPAIVISASGQAAGAEFVAEHPVLASFPHAIDAGGEWLKQNFGVDTSPSVLVFARGRLQSAHTFAAATMLRNLPAAAAETSGQAG